MKPKRLLKNVNVSFISLVRRGANNKTIIWKHAEGSNDRTFDKAITISKTDDEKQMVFGIVYSPDEVDAHGDVMTAPEIEKMAYRFMKEGQTQQVDRQHDFQADEGFIAESWIVKEGDPYFEEIGSWAVGIKVEDRGTWEAVKSGEITGISIAGSAETETLEVEKAFASLIDDFKKFYEKLIKGPTQTKQEDDTLTPEQVQEAIEKALQPINERMTQFSDALKEVVKSEDFESLKKTVEELEIPTVDEIEKRLEKVEKASNGKLSVDGQEIENGEEGDDTDNIWV